MAKSLFVSPFTTAFFQGKIATGAKMFFYQTETLTPIDIVDESGDPLPNPISADLYGQFRSIYIDDDVIEYRVRLTTSDGQLIGDYDPDDNLSGFVEGAIAGLLADLAMPSGANDIGFSQTETYSQGTIGLHGQASLSIKDAPFNADGDRVFDNAPSISAAYTFAVSANDQYPRSVFHPSGNYNIKSSLPVPQQAAFYGEGASSIINCQGQGFTSPLWVNADTTGLINGQWHDIGGYGGSHAIKLTASAENASVQLTNFVALLQTTANIEVNQLFQTAKILNSTLGNAPYGLKVNSSGTNATYIMGTEFTQHSVCSLYLRGAQALNVIGGRFEGGGVTGNNTIDIESSDSVTFVGVYFENTGEFLLRCANMNGTVTFQNCHFTGTTAGTAPPVGGIRPYQWDCGNTKIVFRDCYSVVPMEAPTNCILEGLNTNIAPSKAVYWGSDYGGGIAAKSIPIPTGLTVGLLSFDRPSNASILNTQAMTGVLTLSYCGIGPAPSGVSRTLMRQYQVLVYAQQIFTMGSALNQLGTDLGNMNGATVVVAQSAATANSLTLTATFAGMVPATENSMQFGWSFEFDRCEGVPESAMLVSIP